MRAIIVFSMLVSVSLAEKNVGYVKPSLVTSDGILDGIVYQVYPRSWKDSDGDGIGDIRGVISKLDYLVDSHIDMFWLSPINTSPMVDFGYDISDFKGIDPLFGTLEDFEALVEAAHNRSLKIVVDLVPNHTSDKHKWFDLSVKNIPPYNDYYVWHPGKLLANGTRVKPNNWIGGLGGPAWTWRDERQAYYLHQFAPQQPDLNFNNDKVVEEMKDVVRFWLKKGVDGVRVDSAIFLIEDTRYLDEPLSGATNNSNVYAYLNHIYTTNQPKSFEILHGWREVMNEFEERKFMMTEAYTNISMNMKFYQYGADFPFNFGMTTDVGKDSKAAEFKKVVDTWMAAMPAGHVPNWVSGNHDRRRIATRFGVKRARSVTAMVLLLPGASVIYNGEEIGMEDTFISWEDTVDPQGCIAGRDHYMTETRDPQRTPFQWDNSTSAGFSTSRNTWLPVNANYKTVNVATEREDKNSYYNMFLKLALLKKSPNFKRAKLVTKLLSENVFAFSRETEQNGSVYVAINFGEAQETVDLSVFNKVPKTLNVYYATDGAVVLDRKVVNDVKNVQIPASGFLVLMTPNAKFDIL
ncbi:alpha-glucosidase [Xylocopa sonorina]|uniref:alpha-glucosidase n=1 Tax=Xylocopa sonorina TaxID=1818115 RepID=UPI00403ABC85